LGIPEGERTGYDGSVDLLQIYVFKLGKKPCLMLFAALDEEIMRCRNRLKFLARYDVRDTRYGDVYITWDSNDLVAYYRGKAYGWICYDGSGFRVEDRDIRDLQQRAPASCAIFLNQEIHITYKENGKTERFRVFARQPVTYQYKHEQMNRNPDRLERDLRW
jgi:hypothetical protein